MVKGRYVAQVEIDFCYKGNASTCDEIRERMNNGWLDNTIKEQVEHIVDYSDHHVRVTRIFANIIDATEENEND